ncbi:hypothetical protein PG2003B_1803 [Bifidobacterium pseudolongum subsp. globosum]|uniref:Uncharacterized protein n=1 Tax=Bifidobacterium pseudolongum subsp. globosum TaxID=1690 RepID=A0A4Q5AQ83_9BIFI|nr:hypothetical protein PG2003B_1803 [Bifidobacterium pseudolongum subsp. globosum]
MMTSCDRIDTAITPNRYSSGLCRHIGRDDVKINAAVMTGTGTAGQLGHLGQRYSPHLAHLFTSRFPISKPARWRQDTRATNHEMQATVLRHSDTTQTGHIKGTATRWNLRKNRQCVTPPPTRHMHREPHISSRRTTTQPSDAHPQSVQRHKPLKSKEESKSNSADQDNPRDVLDRLGNGGGGHAASDTLSRHGDNESGDKSAAGDEHARKDERPENPPDGQHPRVMTMARFC